MAEEKNLATANPRRGRQNLTEQERELAAAKEVMAELRADCLTLTRGELAQSLDMAQAAGMITAFQYNETANRVGMLRLLAQIRDSKAYKGVTVTHRSTGELVTVKTWEEFCTAHGYSYRKIAEDLQNLAAFGDNLLELQDRLGLGYRDLRLLRGGLASLPPEEQRALLAEVTEADGPEELQQKLDDLRLELAQARTANKTLMEDMAAKEKVSKQKSEKLDALEEQVAKLTSVHPEDADQRRAELNAQALKHLDDCCLEVTMKIFALCGQGASMMAHKDITDHTIHLMHERVSVLIHGVADAILTAGFDVDLHQRFTPLEFPEPAAAGAAAATDSEA